jgi:hypothetical protein
MDEVYEEPDYAKCVNSDCTYYGFSFAPPPSSDQKRFCPSCGMELKPWEARAAADEGS